MASNQIDLSPESLIKVAKKVKLEESLKEIELKSEKLKLRAEIEGMDISEDLAKNEKEIEALKKNSAAYESYEHPVLSLMQKHGAVQERLRKLNDKKDQIQQAVYDSLKDEYLGEKEVLSQQLDFTITQLKKIQQEASNGTHSLKYALDELSVRKEIEEIPDDVYNERTEDMKSQLAQSEELMTAVTLLLKLVEK